MLHKKCDSGTQTQSSSDELKDSGHKGKCESMSSYEDKIDELNEQLAEMHQRNNLLA